MNIPKWFKVLSEPLPLEKRRDVIKELAPAASPGLDFFLLVVLSCSIATLGLITDSAAVIIGAMLLAPLMTPIIGIGMASITGDSRLLKGAVSTLLKGVFLAILLAALVTLVNNYLPIISLQELPNEVMARTRPTPIDLVIALSGGLAAAYALTKPNLSAALPGVAIATALMPPLCTIGIGISLGRWDVAGGATLLFITNTVAIAFASALVFFLRGFGASVKQETRRLPRSLFFSALLTAILLIPLTYYSLKFFSEASENKFIQSVVRQEVQNLGNAELVDVNINRIGDTVDMLLTLRTNTSISYQQVVSLQAAIVKDINLPVSLKVNQVFAERLDPLIPPTPTATSTITPTSTRGPSPTATNTPSATNTSTTAPTLTATPTSTSTITDTPLPTFTPTATSTPALAEVVATVLPELKIYQTPGGPVIGTLHSGQVLKILYRSETLNGLVWVEVIDEEGRNGWIPEIYLHILTPTPTVSATPTSTPSLSPSFTPEITATS